MTDISREVMEEAIDQARPQTQPKERFYGEPERLIHIAEALRDRLDEVEKQNNQLHDEVGRRGNKLGECNAERRMLREDEAGSAQENARLRDWVDELEAEVRQTDELKRENARAWSLVNEKADGILELEAEIVRLKMKSYFDAD